MNEAAIVAVGLAAAEGFSSTDKVVPDGDHEATPEAENNSVESGTIEPQREHEVDVTAPIADDTPDIVSNLRNDPTPVTSPLEPESSHIETELLADCHVEITSSATTNGNPIDVDDQPAPSSSETALNTQTDIEVQTQADDTSNIKDEVIPKSDIAQHIDSADTGSAPEDVPASSTKESQSDVQLEPEVDFIAPTEEEPSAIAQVAADDLLPKVESEEAVSQSLG